MPEIVVHSRQVEMLPLAALKSYERNARTHPDNQITALVNIIRDSGFTNPLLVDDDDVIIAGHGRAEAARKLKMTEVPCVRVSGLSPEQVRALRLSDNQSGLLSGYDDAMLRIELGELRATGFDLSLTGFTGLDLSKLFATTEGDTDPDEIPDPPAVPASQVGDLWRLGEHWLICGDCTDPTVVERVMGGASPHLMVTDPPYGVNYDPAWRNRALGEGNRSVGQVKNDDRVDWREAWKLFKGDVAYVWHAGLFGAVVEASLVSSGFELRTQIVWVKQHFAIGRGHYHSRHEPCFYAVRKGTKGHWQGDRTQDTVWEINNGLSQGGARKIEDGLTGHGTQKPVEAMARPIRNNSAAGEHVYDPFMGSGTTIIAAQMNKRIAHGCELEPAYADVCCARFAAFTGTAPILAETGETFEQVKARRVEVV